MFELEKKLILSGMKLILYDNTKIVAHAYLYLLYNDLHAQPFGLMEDVFVEEPYRGKGIGSKLVEELITEARAQHCYKLICTIRHEKPRVHELYKRLGFFEQGLEFRINF